MKENVVGMTVHDQITVIFRRRLEARVGGLDVNVRWIAGPSEHALDSERLMTDGVTIAKRRHDLMDTDPAG